MTVSVEQTVAAIIRIRAAATRAREGLMAKRIVWSEALAAYDRDRDVLEAIRTDYIQFAEQTVADVAGRVKSLSGGKITPHIWTAEEKEADFDCVAEWEPVAPRAIGGLGVRAFLNAGDGGAPGSFTIELWLDARAAVPVEFGTVDMLAALLNATANLPGETHNSKKHSNVISAGVVHLRLVTVDIAAADLVEQIATAFFTYCEAAKRLTDEIVLAPRGADPYRCARMQLLEIRTSRRTELDAIEAKWSWDPEEEKLDEWEAGRYLGVSKKLGDGKTDNLWVCALPDGDVVFAASGPVTSEKVRWKKLCAFANGDARTFKDGPGATLLNSSAVRALAQVGKARDLGDLVVDLFRAFLTP
jgi:hypothetical protein